jgi:carbohydrate kinase (thermoresistant glucokinase family)
VIVVVMGVAGAGKTTVGRLVAAELGVPFHDADDFHSEENRRKMAAGVALSERDRRPWLQKLAEHIPVWEAEGGAVLACSALKGKHRSVLEDASPGHVFFVFLDADPELIRPRLAARTGHYMPASLLESQLASLEPPAAGDALSVRVDRTPSQIAQAIVAEIRQNLDRGVAARGLEVAPQSRNQ